MPGTAPWIDINLECLLNRNSYAGIEIHRLLMEIYQAMGSIEPVSEDETRQIWLEIPRGSLEDYADPDEFKNENIILFLTWILAFVNSEINAIRQDTDHYNRELAKNLPYHKRTGKIKRQIFWNILGADAIRLNEKIGKDSINTLQKIVENRQDEVSVTSIPKITAAQYFRFCEICYDANNYFNETDGDLSPVEKYKQMADGRCGGLTPLEPDSEESFRQWYHGEEILRMITGTDYIGIVPDHISPR